MQADKVKEENVSIPKKIRKKKKDQHQLGREKYGNIEHSESGIGAND